MSEETAAHKPTDIKGYRNLTPEEVAMVNEVKAHAESTRALVERVAKAAAMSAATIKSADGKVGRAMDVNLDMDALSECTRWVGMATDNLQTGYMQLIRALTRPATF